MDLANELLRTTYNKKNFLEETTGLTPETIRRTIVKAKRFMLDQAFSEFAAHLALVPFQVALERRPDVMNSLRHSAIPPWDTMFVQLDGHAFRRGLLQIAQHKTDLWGDELLEPSDNPLTSENEIVKHLGWLIERDGSNVKMTEYFNLDGGVASLPFYYLYSLDDKGYKDGMMWKGHTLSTKASSIAHGIIGLYDDRFAVVYSGKHIPEHFITVQDESGKMEPFKVHRLVPEFGGSIRYLLAFLATLNETPKYETDVRPQKGFLGRGQIRKYMDYTTLTLKLPARTTKVNLAKRLIAQARRGWHEVRPHFRRQILGTCGPTINGIDPHTWSATDTTGHSTCSCGAKRVYITLPHGRGDPTIAVRTHKYVVTHNTDR